MRFLEQCRLVAGSCIFFLEEWDGLSDEKGYAMRTLQICKAL